jgi:hypothetical protein
MPLDNTALGLTLPHPENDPRNVDVDRIRASLILIDALITSTNSDVTSILAALALKASATSVTALEGEVDTQRASLDQLVLSCQAFETAVSTVLNAHPPQVLSERLDAETIARNEAFDALRPIQYIDLTESSHVKSGYAYRLRAAGLNLTLPADPANGAAIYFVGGDVGDPTEVSVLGNGKLIDGAASLDISPISADILFWFDGVGWRSKPYANSLGVISKPHTNSGPAQTFSAAGGYNYFPVTLSENSTFTLDAAGQVSVLLYVEIENGAAFDVAWVGTIQWDGNVEPPLLVSGKSLLGFLTTDQGATWKGIPMWGEA